MASLNEIGGIVFNLLDPVPTEEKFIPKKERKKKRCEQP